MADFRMLDTSKFDSFISAQPSLLSTYNELSKRYTDIVEDLRKEWKGSGAEAFESDAQKVKINIVGIQDILQTMCDTLYDCREIFEECDSSMGTANRNAIKKG